jgi:hypothetical protein
VMERVVMERVVKVQSKPAPLLSVPQRVPSSRADSEPGPEGTEHCRSPSHPPGCGR